MCLIKRMRTCFLLLLLTAALFQVGCTSADTAPSGGNIDSSGNSVSSVPWNKPESWETTGQLGGMSGH
jgi:hypothetical protein